MSQPILTGSPAKGRKNILVEETILVKGEHSIELKINNKYFGGPSSQ